MRDFYERFYQVVNQSPVHACFCARAFGRNLCQHGFADMAQLDALLAAIQPTPGQHLLDLGCGNGMIAEYMSDVSGAHVTGLDYIPEAIRQAQKRTAHKAENLSFVVGDINALTLPPHTFDAVLSIDTIYFSDDYRATVSQLAQALRPGGSLAFFYAHGWIPGVPPDTFDQATLAPEQTPLAQALRANGLRYSVQDFTGEEYRLAQLRIAILTELEAAFANEALLFIFNNRMGEAKGISRAIELGLHRRYLYIA